MGQDATEMLCKRCGKKKEHADKPLCLACWRKGKRFCHACGKMIIGEPDNYKYCQSCFRKKIYE